MNDTLGQVIKGFLIARNPDWGSCRDNIGRPMCLPGAYQHVLSGLVNTASFEHHHLHFLPCFCFWHAIIMVLMIRLHLNPSLPPENEGPSNTEETSAEKAQPVCWAESPQFTFECTSIQYFLQCNERKHWEWKTISLGRERNCCYWNRSKEHRETAHPSARPVSCQWQLIL